MKKPLNATQQLNRRFLWSLLSIAVIIGSTEMLIMIVLDLYQQSGRILSPIEETCVDTLLLTLISGPLLWFFVMRRLVVTISQEQEKVVAQSRQNKELRTALDAHALVSIADNKGRIVYANQKFSQISGYSIEELLGQDHRIINSGIHDKSFFRDLWQRITKGEIWQGTICNRSKNGSLYWVDSTIVPLLDEEKIPIQYISIRRDITTQKANESRLKMLKRAVDACSEMILITDTNGYIQYANPALLKFCFWTEESLLGQQMNVFNSPNNTIKTLKELENTLKRHEAWSGRILSRRKGEGTPLGLYGQSLAPDPYEFWSEISVTPVVNDDGSLFGYVQIIRDISDIVVEEQQSQIEKEDKSARLEIADILQRDIPLKERFITTLNILFELKDFAVERKAGVFLKSQKDDVFEVMLLEGNFSVEFIDRWQRVKSGDYLCGRTMLANNLDISDICIRDPKQGYNLVGVQAHGHSLVPLATGDEILGLLFLYNDSYPFKSESRLTMLKQVGELMALAIMREQAQTALEKARDMAMQASLSKSEFLANMSHEIRTPMNGVLGMLELLHDTNLTTSQWDLVETAHNSAESLLEIINDVLDFSKIEAGKIEIEKISFDFGTLIEEVAALLSKRAFSKGLELNCFLPPTGWHHKWMGDPMRIRQVLTNLIGNAIKFTEDGEVSISLKPLSEQNGIQQFRCEIRDTGIGIPSDVQARLFQAFTQAETATARRFGGTGLGLSICKSLVALMGGEIGLESEAGQGSCFWFTLPLSKDESENGITTIDFSGKRTLVVDDNATNRMILKHYLTHWGMEVDEADDGQAALAVLNASLETNRTYDLILLDMHMPVMDGLALAANLSENKSFKAIPRIVLSSGTFVDENQRHQYGIAYSLMKPVRQSHLFDAIADLLSTISLVHPSQVKSEAIFSDYHNRKILVVEDNKVNQKVILGLLEKFKIEPVVADNGQLALDLLKNQSFDLIFMDCQMPVLDGYKTTAEIRKSEQANGLPKQVIVALTAHAIAEERDKCLAAGMDDYLSKPIRREQLAKVLAIWLDQPASGNSNELSAPVVESDTIAKTYDDKMWDQDQAIKNLDGDKDLLADMIQLFLEEMPLLLANLNDAYRENNLFELGNTAHAIKGSVSYFCAAEVTECASRLERAAHQKDATDYRTLKEALEHGANSLMDVLRQSTEGGSS